MGQTLTHGIYLPDEGERNCYSGLAANWQLLDGAVGTVAEHSTQIAGKAPLVHTHSKADITDFPVYGTTAGTICEGNDSRLSDARTPVAHTHTKSDVTDLLNSNFIPSANNSYDLGSSSYQWNNLYANKVNTQSVNGIDPGALSLPDMGTTADVNYFDFISTITHLDGTNNFYTPTVDGWMTVIIKGTALTLFEDANSGTNHNQGSGVSAAPVDGYCLATIPVHKGKRVKIQVTGTSIHMAQVRPCLGNV